MYAKIIRFLGFLGYRKTKMMYERIKKFLSFWLRMVYSVFFRNLAETFVEYNH